MTRFAPLMILPLLIFLGLTIVFMFGMYRENPDVLPSSLEGQMAPSVELAQLPGKTLFNDDALRSGQVTLVNFWASWCAPCRAEHPQLEQLKDEGEIIFGINYKDDQDKALLFLSELGDPYLAVGADKGGRMALDWGLYGVPETYVIAGDGTIVFRFAGPITEKILNNEIRTALNEAKLMSN